MGATKAMSETELRVRKWIASNRGWHSLHQVRAGSGMGCDQRDTRETGSRSLVSIVRQMAEDGSAEIRGGGATTFEVRAKE